MSLISDSDAQRIGEAINAAERRTSGEIIAVIARESSTYTYVPLLYAGLIALLVPWPFIFFTWMRVETIYLIQIVVFVAIALAAWTRPLRYWLVPGRVKRERAHRRAVEQFLAQNLHTTKGRTGVMIFASEAERFAEVIADIDIREKVGNETWQRMVDQLIARISANEAGDGFIDAVSEAGRHLAAHFPPGSYDPNELPNHLIVLD